MLEHVTANQMRFVMPGLSADTRGVALGRHCLVLLPSVDRVVGLLRGLSREMSIDDLRAGLRIEQVITPLKSKELVVLLPVRSSYAADQVAAVAGLNGGLTFTGTARHFVQFRDSRSPLGYDVASLEAGGGDYVLYAQDFVQSYAQSREISLDRLIMGLSLVEEPTDRLAPGEEAVLRVEHGLWRPVLGYLHRNRRPCAVASCDTRVLGEDGAEPRRLHLMRTALEPRMEALFRDTPGVGVHRLINENTAVEVGFRHPVELTSVREVFPENCFYLFSGPPGRLEVVAGSPIFVDAADLVQLGGADQEMGLVTHDAQTPHQVEVPLRLVTSPGTRRAVKASRIPLRQAGQLKKLIYLLPPRVLERTQIALVGEEVFLFGEEGLEFFPLGELHYELARGVFAPLGYELIPRVHPEVLLQHLERQGEINVEGGELHFFSPNNPVALRISRQAFAPLSRRALADVPLQTPPPMAVALPDQPADPRLINDPPGLFPLWGYQLERIKEQEQGEEQGEAKGEAKGEEE